MEELKGKSLEELKALRAALDKEEKARDKREKDAAVKKIKAIAKQAGLSVEIKGKARKKRGRPPAVKSDGG